MVDSDNLLDIFFQMLKDVIESITLPTGANLLPSFFYALAILVATVLGTLFDWPIVVVSWQGAAIATLALGVLVFIERRGMDEVSRLYRAAKSRIDTAKKGTTRPSPALQAEGGTNPGDEDDTASGGAGA